MLKKAIWVVAVTAGCLVLVGSPLHAQKEKKQTDEEIQQERMQKLITAYQLAEQGRKENAPEFLITAAAMLRELSRQEGLQKIKPVDFKATVEVDGKTIPKAKLEITGTGKAELDKDVKPKSLLEQSNELYADASDMAASL